MPVLELNGETFHVEKLHPFGEELTPRHPLNVVDFARKDILAITEAVRSRLLLVLRNTKMTKTDGWQPMPPTEPRHSNVIWHIDGKGEIPAHMLRTLKGDRQPTGFALRGPIAAAMKENQHLLDPLFFSSPFQDPDLEEFMNIYRRLSTGDPDFRLQDIHTLYIRLNDDSRVPDVSVLDRNGKNQRELHLRSRHAHGVALLQFIRAVNKSLGENIFRHAWSEKPDATVIAFNGLEDDGQLTVAHCRLPETKDPSEGTLLRKQIIQSPGGNFYMRSVASA